MIIEDDTNIRKIIKDHLEARGYSVLEACDGEDGYELSSSAHIIILDIYIPKINGIDLLEKIRNIGDSVPVVIVSAGQFSREEWERLTKLNFIQYVKKPFGKAELMAAVEKANSTYSDLETLDESTRIIGEFIERQSVSDTRWWNKR